MLASRPHTQTRLEAEDGVTTVHPSRREGATTRLSHPHPPAAQAFDGVTTHLELEFGAWPVGAWYEARAERGCLLNYGVSCGPCGGGCTPDWPPYRLESSRHAPFLAARH